jgi:hypothetical protein
MLWVLWVAWSGHIGMDGVACTIGLGQGYLREWVQGFNARLVAR